ncbi:MAG: choice-of-anchor D domain-containing protein, partial [Planctomycetes bacterium]|nr:choice-of-anchor D domain-containing protein [Planctomycetota bacterium]
IASGGFADLQITVTPTAGGTFSFDIDINSDDVDENPYDIHVDGTSAPGGEIHVERPVSTSIPDGGSDSLGGGHVAGVNIILDYIVYNQGSAALTINSAGLTGLVNCAANITGSLPGTIANGAQATLQVTVSPNAAGNFSFDIDIDSNDVDESNYDISVDGTAIPGGEIDIQRPAGVAFSIADGSGSDSITPTTAGVTTFATYTIENLGTAGLTLTGQSFNTPNNCNVIVGAPVLSSLNPGQTTTFQVQVTPTASGSWDFELVVNSNDVNEATYNFPVSGNAAPGGEIHVERPVGTGIADGATDNIGNGFVAGVGSVLTYRVFNQGTAALNISGVSLTGQTNCGAVVTTALPASIANGAFADLQVTVTPTALGAFSFDIDIDSDDIDESTYDIHADGSAAPGGEIDVQQPAPTSIANGGSQTVNGTVAGATTQLIYTVENTGTGDLTITGTGTTGALNNVGVVVGTVGSTVLTPTGPGSTTTFTVDITPTALGAWSFTLQVTSNDTTDPSYTIAVGGNAAPGGEIELQRPALSPIANGGNDNVAGTVAGATTQVTYTIENTGTGDLTITGTGTTGALNNVGVIVGTVGSTVLTPAGAGSTTTFTVDITPTALGAWSFTLQINSNDTTDPSYTINVSDTAVPGGEIHVERPVSTNIFDGGTDNTGNSHVAGVGTVLTYTVRNLGTAVMTLSGIAISNETNCAVVVTGALPGSIPNGNSAPLQLTVTPTASGSFSFDFDINSNDQDENPYDIHVDGNAAPGGEIDIQQPALTSIASGGSQTVNGTVAGATTQLTYTIENQGTGDLTISGTGTTGALNNVGVVVGTVGSAVLSTSGPGSTTTFTVDITPTALGAWSFVLRVSNDDTNENPYDINVSGSAAPGGEIQVERPASTVILDGAPDSLTGTHVAGVGTVLNYTVRNLGTAGLTITGTAFSNEINCAAVVTGALPGTIANGAFAVLQVTVTPSAAGPFSFDLDINSNDVDESTYDIAVDGTALAGGEINLQRPGGTTILHNGSDPVTGAVAGASTSLFYTIQNLGTADLTISGQSFNTNNNCNVTVFAPAVNPIA